MAISLAKFWIANVNTRTGTEPYLFDEFFESGLAESVSPFLTRQSRRWARNIPFKTSIASAVLLACSFAFSFFYSLNAISGLMLALVYFFAGIPKLIDSIEDLLNLEVNIDVLMTLAAFLSVLIGSSMEGGLLLVLFAISGSIEELVTAKAKGAVRSLHQLTPSTACVIDAEGQVRPRHVRDVTAGMHILIKAGEIAPLDSRVVSGNSFVNLAHLTGESVPVQKGVGDELPAGAMNMEGTLTVEVLRTSSDSTVARIIQLVTQAQEARPRFQRWLDRANRAYAIGIIGLSVLFAFTFPLILPMPYLGGEGSIYRALAFLIAASPCALILAIPIAYLSAIGACARSGALLKGGVTLDALASCKAIAFDKTGTLTTGQFTFLGIEPLYLADTDQSVRALQAATALEKHAVHPIAEALVRHHQGTLPDITHFRFIAGFGVEGTIHSESEQLDVFVGHLSYVRSRFTAQMLVDYERRLKELQEMGQIVSTLWFNCKPFLLKFQDSPRLETAQVLAQLRQSNKLRLFMLTGDHAANACQVAHEVGIEEYYADLRPEDKLAHVSRLNQEMRLAMVGDGINDAPALARATVGISMGRVGSHTAIEASDIVLLHDNLKLLPWLWSKAIQTVSIVKQNVVLAVIAIIGASLSALLGWIPLWLAVTLHEGGTVVVGLNGLRLLRTAMRSENSDLAGKV